MKSHVLHTVWCNITGEAAGEIWTWSLLGRKRPAPSVPNEKQQQQQQNRIDQTNKTQAAPARIKFTHWTLKERRLDTKVKIGTHESGGCHVEA